MNTRLVGRLLGNVITYEAIFMLISLLVSLYYGETAWLSFLYSIVIMLLIGLPLSRLKPKETMFHIKDGFVSVALSWFILALFGALPFYFSGYFNGFMDCFFESTSGFTTTGSTILVEIENLPRGILFWRAFTHWIGGMGVLIFMLALMPGSASLFNIMRAESPGPSPTKIVPKIKESAKILYEIYLVMTISLIILLMIAGLPLYDSIIHAFSTAGTGGFSNMNLSVGAYNSVAVEIILTIYMLLFGINFSLYFFIIKKDFKNFFRDEELRLYIGIVFVCIVLITVNLIQYTGSFSEALRQASFQVSTVITTTGYSTVDYNFWPTFSKVIIIFLMLLGSCAGSTGGGIKIMRILVLIKTVRLEVSKLIHPRVVKTVKINGKNTDQKIVSEIAVFIFVYAAIFIFGTLLISLENMDMITSVTSVLSAMSNLGHGFEMVGPMGDFSSFSDLSKGILSFLMIAGRLEFFPVFVLFMPSVWKRTIRNKPNNTFSED